MLSKLKRFISNQSGSSLIEVMISMAIAGVMSLAILKINENAQKSMTKIESDAALRRFKAIIRSRLADSNNCTTNLGAIADYSVAVGGYVAGPVTLTANGDNFITSSGPGAVTDAGGRDVKYDPESQWEVMAIRYGQFQPNEAGGISGKCPLEFQVERKRKKVSFGATEFIFTVDIFCQINQSAAPYQVIGCNAISSDDDGYWIKTRETGGAYMTYVNYNETAADRVTIGQVPPIAGTVTGTDPIAPLTIYSNEAVWNFPVFRDGVNLPKDGVYSWIDPVTGVNGEWGISEIGPTGSSCLNFLGFASPASGPQIVPYVKFCKDNLETNSAATGMINESITWFRNSVKILQGDYEMVNGNVIMADSDLGSGNQGTNSGFGLPGIPDWYTTPTSTTPTWVNVTRNGTTGFPYTNTFMLGTGNKLNQSNSGALGSVNHIDSEYSFTIGIGNYLRRLTNAPYSAQKGQMFAIGELNTLGAYHTASGTYTNSGYGTTSQGYDQDVVVAGFNNSTHCSGCFVFGENNQINRQSSNSNSRKYIFGTYNSSGYARPIAGNYHGASDSRMHYIFGNRNDASYASGESEVFLLGNHAGTTYQNHGNMQNVMVLSAHGVGPDDNGLYTAKRSGQIAMHAEDGFRFFVNSRGSDNKELEALRLTNSGNFLHGKLKIGERSGAPATVPDSPNLSIAKDFGTAQGSLILASNTSTTKASLSAIIASWGSMIEEPTNSPNINENLTTIIASRNSMMNARQASGIYSSQNSNMAQPEPGALGYGNVIYGSDGSTMHAIRANSVILGGNNNQMFQHHPDSLRAYNNIIVNSHATDMQIDCNPSTGGKNYSNNVDINSTQMMWRGMANACNGSGFDMTRNVMIQNEKSNIMGGSDNIMMNSIGTQIEFLANSVVLNAGMAGSPATTFYGYDSATGADRLYGLISLRNSDVQFNAKGAHYLLAGSHIYKASNTTSTFGIVALASTIDNSSNNYNLNIDDNISHRMYMRFGGGIALNVEDDMNKIALNPSAIGGSRGLVLEDNTGWKTTSTREAKENFTSLDEAFVQNFINLPIERWKWKGRDDKDKFGNPSNNITPYAEDFYDAFGLGKKEDRDKIATIDIAGVNIAAMQVAAKKNESTLGILGKIKQFFTEIFSTLKNILNEAKEIYDSLMGDSEIDLLERKLASLKEQDLAIKKKLCSKHPEMSSCKDIK